ncbi:unnamed protein product [Allacma fusca]|uniref:PXA domain-containing protein n=1 Tax=Allacma fusca TaxID=39272 RepID=A0A8J2KDV5_9HEXA|nr:unnamed protein product [Allacma fusca]
MTEEKHRCQQFSDPKSQQESFLSLFYQHKCLPVLSVVIILASVAIKYLTELKLIFGLSNSLPWGNPVLLWCCFLLYSLGLIWISLVLSQRLYSKSATTGSPNAITTLRSHLTFLPIIHFIRQRPCTFENSAGILNNDQGDGASWHSSGDDKEYLSKLEFQRDSLIDVILESCVCPWYERISDEKTFPQQSKQILQATFDRLAKKFRHMDRTATTREAIEIIHFHWKSYCEAASKPTSTEENLERNFKYVHSCVETREELSKHYENILRLLLKDLVIPDLQSNLLCQFLAGLLVKGFLLYYIELISDPKWINFTLKKYITDGVVNAAVPSILSTGSSQDSLPESISPASKCDSMETQSSHLEFEELSSGEIIPLVRLMEEGETAPNPPQMSLDSNEVSSSQGVEENPVGSNFNRSNGDDKSKKSATLSAALGGVLSTTALTLLPEGSSYNLKGLESGETSRASPSTSEHSQTQYGYSDKDNTQPGDNQMPSGGHPAPVESPSANKSVISINSRHFSIDDYTKVKTTLAEEKTSKSLDETKGNCNVIRQQEFNFSFDDTNKLQVDTSAKNDVSPTYDEAEDFAATIAKLRSLLEQRESQKNLVENINMHDNEPEVFNNSPPEKHSPEKVTTQQHSPQPIKSAVDNIRPSLNSQSSASSLGSDASFGSNNSHSSLDTEK